MAPPASTAVCRFYRNGQCAKGSSCSFVHDRSTATPNPCKYYQSGHCVYGASCIFDHVRPQTAHSTASSGGRRANSSGASSSKDAAKTSSPSSTVTRSGLPKPVSSVVVKSTLNANAPAFVPSWLKKEPLEEGSSYAQAAGATSSCNVFVDEDGVVNREKNLSLCPYHELGNCPRGDECDFVHGELCELCGNNVLHPFDEVFHCPLLMCFDQRKVHTAECSKNHEVTMQWSFMEQQSREKQCGICMEAIFDKNLRFGILENCKHVFCLECIREWRKNTESFDAETVRSCPECRQHSYYVVPSVVWVEEKEEKELLFKMYVENTRQRQCKYYKPYRTGDCPFGNKCFYKHQNPDGSMGEDGPPMRQQRRSRALLSDYLFVEEDSDEEEDDEQLSQLLHMTEAVSRLQSLVSRILRMNNV